VHNTIKSEFLTIWHSIRNE